MVPTCPLFRGSTVLNSSTKHVCCLVLRWWVGQCGHCEGSAGVCSQVLRRGRELGPGWKQHTYLLHQGSNSGEGAFFSPRPHGVHFKGGARPFDKLSPPWSLTESFNSTMKGAAQNGAVDFFSLFQFPSFIHTQKRNPQTHLKVTHMTLRWLSHVTKHTY